MLLFQAQQTAILDGMIIYRSNPAQALLREREALESRSNLSLLDLMKCVVTTVPQSSTIAAQATRPDWGRLHQNYYYYYRRIWIMALQRWSFSYHTICLWQPNESN